MKYPSAYYLLLLYLILVCRPLIPLVQDIYEHTFDEANHLATVHHLNGMDHVHYEVGRMEKEDVAANGVPSKPKFSGEISCHCIFNNGFTFNSLIASNNVVFTDARSFFPFVFQAVQLRPPKG